MIVVRFRVKCKPDKSEQLRAAFETLVGPSRAVEGVISYDIAQDVTDPDVFVATEIFVDRAALNRQGLLPGVNVVMELLPDVLAAEPEAMIYNVSSSEPWGE